MEVEAVDGNNAVAVALGKPLGLDCEFDQQLLRYGLGLPAPADSTDALLLNLRPWARSRPRAPTAARVSGASIPSPTSRRPRGPGRRQSRLVGGAGFEPATPTNAT